MNGLISRSGDSSRSFQSILEIISPVRWSVRAVVGVLMDCLEAERNGVVGGSTVPMFNSIILLKTRSGFQG
jgi:hypothetical protein